MKKSKKLIISKWDEAGLLLGLEGNVKENVALAFEEVNNFLESQSKLDKDLLVLFPMTRCVLSVMNNDKYVFNIKEFLELFYKYQNGLNNCFKENPQYFRSSSDEEADKFRIIVDSMIDYINKK